MTTRQLLNSDDGCFSSLVPIPSLSAERVASKPVEPAPAWKVIGLRLVPWPPRAVCSSVSRFVQDLRPPFLQI